MPSARESLDRLMDEIRACKQRVVDRYLREAERCRRRAADLEARAKMLKGRTWRQVACHCELRAARELENLE